jgi:hypothetical protein
MALGVAALLAALVSHGKSLGRFVDVLDYEPKSAPAPRGITLALWADPITPVRSSGLAATTASVQFAARLYRAMMADRQSDAEILGALDALMGAYSADFTLGDQIRGIDLLGAYGASLAAVPGYIEHDHKTFRVIDLTVPLIVNDLWTQAP